MATDQTTIQSYNKLSTKYDEKHIGNFYHKYVEKPAMNSLLPSLSGKKILCIGVGTGFEAGMLKAKGAESVIGIDISEGMVAKAKENFPNIEFRVGDMNNLKFEDTSFDFVYSSLAFHYSDNLHKTFGDVNRVLKKNGMLLFSTTHPAFDPAKMFKENDISYRVIGHRKINDNVEILGDYLTERKIETEWEPGVSVNFYHHTLSTWINSLVASGFTIDKVVEPKPLKESQDLFPDKFKIYSARPGFIIFRVNKDA